MQLRTRWIAERPALPDSWITNCVLYILSLQKKNIRLQVTPSESKISPGSHYHAMILVALAIAAVGWKELPYKANSHVSNELGKGPQHDSWIWDMQAPPSSYRWHPHKAPPGKVRCSNLHARTRARAHARFAHARTHARAHVGIGVHRRSQGSGHS